MWKNCDETESWPALQLLYSYAWRWSPRLVGYDVVQTGIYIYVPIFLKIVQLQHPARAVRPFVCSSERNLEKFLCQDSQTIMGTGSEPETVRILVQVIITAPRHSSIILPHNTRSCCSMIDALLSFTYIHQVLKSQEKQCAYKCYNEARSRNHFCCGNAIRITYCEFVSIAWVIQHAKRVLRILLLSVACLAVPYFYHIIS
jgi:hypothetical protein